METKAILLESDEMLKAKKDAYRLDDKAFADFMDFLSRPERKEFVFNGEYSVRVTEREDGNLYGEMRDRPF